jgi:hypothetical protein
MKQLPGISLEYSSGVQRVTNASGELNKWNLVNVPQYLTEEFTSEKALKSVSENNWAELCVIKNIIIYYQV